MKTKEDDLISRAELLQQAIATLQLMIQQMALLNWGMIGERCDR
jgi:hypothetical protein